MIITLGFILNFLGRTKNNQNNLDEELNQEFKLYKNNFVENLINVFRQLKLLKSTTFIIKSLSVMCYDNFIEMNEIKLAIEFLLLSFCDDCKYESYKEKNLERIFHLILTDGFNDKFFKVFELPDSIFLIYPNLEFLRKLVTLYSNLKVNKNLSNYFFYYFILNSF